jgi:hypothetical protein
LLSPAFLIPLIPINSVIPSNLLTLLSPLNLEIWLIW